MLAAFVLVAVALVGLAAYILYLTPNPKDPI